MRNVNTQKQKVLEKKIKEQNPYADRDHIIERKDIPKQFFHPHWILAICLALIVVYGIATGIYLANHSCGDHYLVLSVLGATPLLFIFNIHIADRMSLANIYKIYLYEGIWILIISIISFGFIQNVLDQSYCSSMWCHPQLNTAVYFNHLRDKVSQNEYNDICAQINDSRQIYNNYGERLTISLQSSMKMFCFKEGNCKLRESFNITQLVKLSKRNTVVLVTFLGIIQIFLAFYWIYFSHRLKTNKLKFTLYQLEMIMTKKVKGPGQSHKVKQVKKGMRQDGVAEDQKSQVNEDGMDMQIKKIDNVVNDVDQLFSVHSQQSENRVEMNDKEQKKKEQQLKEMLKQKKNLGDSLDFEINLRRKSEQDLENNVHNVSFSHIEDNNHDNNGMNFEFNDNLSYINQNNMSFNLDTQNVINKDDNTILPFQPTQTRFYENPEMNNTFYHSYTQENDTSIHQIPTQNNQ